MPMLTQKFRKLRLNDPSEFKLIVNVPEGFGDLASEMKAEIEKLGSYVTIVESNDPSKNLFLKIFRKVIIKNFHL